MTQAKKLEKSILEESSLESAIYEASERRPMREGWGLRLTNELPASVPGSGSSMSLWFADKEELIDFVSHYHLEWTLQAEEHQMPAKTKMKFKQMMKKVRDGVMGVQEACDELNPMFKGFVHVEWCGPVRDLMTSEHDYCAMLREEFSEEAGENPRYLAKNLRLAEEFLEFIYQRG